LVVEILTYDPAANAARLRRHPGLAMRRAWQILWTFGWFWVRHWIAHQNWLPHSKSALEREIATARYLTSCLVALGPTFIKMGQAMSTRPDVLPRTYIQEFTKLQDKVPAYDTKIAIATIERELEKSIEHVFPSFDPQPISAASMGQVYRARTREGDRVAVKVQRPNLPWILSIDLAILRLFAAYAEWRNKLLSRRRAVGGTRAAFDLFVKDMPYVAITDQFGKSLFDQTDFLLEGRNAETFNRNFADFENVRAPLVYWTYTTRQVITQELIDGVKFNDVAAIEKMGVDFRHVVVLGVRALVKQLLEDGIFHADTHPGNIIVTPAGDVVYIDWGMTDSLPRDLQLKLVDMFVHLTRAEYEEFCEDLVDLDMFPPDVDRSLLVPIVADIYDTQLGKRGSKRYSMTEVIDRVSDVLYQYPFRLPERFSFLMRTVGTMEGVVLSVWPDFRYLDVALPYAAKLLLTLPDPVIRDRLAFDLLQTGRLDTQRLADTVLLALKETTFQVGEVLPDIMRWVLSAEGERLLEAGTDAVFSGDRQAEKDLELVFQVVLEARDLDPASVVVPFLRWIGATPDGLAYFDRVLPRLRSLPPRSGLAQSLAEVLSHADPADARQVVDEVFRFARLALSEPHLNLQPAVDWLAEWAEDPRAKRAIGSFGGAIGGSWDPELIDQALEIADMALQSGLDLRPLVQAGRSLLLGPEGEMWRTLSLEIVLSGSINGRAATVLAHLLQRPDLLAEMAATVPAALLFAISPEASRTRRNLLDLVRRLLLGTRPRLMLPEGNA
jgi:predicted unusual protein kinase regulating ubiquinone biosynthesis (AarF/ABC1/UbiB family)